MNGIKEATAVEPTREMIPAQPGEQPPETKISELDRAQLSEAWNEALATRNALLALQAEQRRLDAERRALEAEAKLQILLGQQQDQRVQQKLEEVRVSYNIPDGWQIDAKTGLVTEPKPEDNAAPTAPA